MRDGRSWSEIVDGPIAKSPAEGPGFPHGLRTTEIKTS